MSTSVDATSVAAIGSRVRALREAGGLSLRDLAERCGVSAPMLSQVERGETSPTLQVAARIAHGLDLRLSQLLRLDEDGAVTIVRAGERRKGPATVRGHRYEAILPQAGEITPFLRVALGARKGWSKDGIIALLCEIARAKSLDAL